MYSRTWFFHTLLMQLQQCSRHTSTVNDENVQSTAQLAIHFYSDITSRTTEQIRQCLALYIAVST